MSRSGAAEPISRSKPAGSKDPSRPAEPKGRRMLIRCPTRTNVLCPCGAVERRLRKLGLAHDTERVPYRRSARPEVEELTRQRRVPVLVDGDEVIHDSKRILQYLDWRYGKAEKRAGAEPEGAGHGRVGIERGPAGGEENEQGDPLESPERTGRNRSRKREPGSARKSG